MNLLIVVMALLLPVILGSPSPQGGGTGGCPGRGTARTTMTSFPRCQIAAETQSIQRYTLRANHSLAVVRDRLYAQIGGSTPIQLKEVHDAVAKGKAAFESYINKRAGPSGFILFQTYSHGAWFSLYGYEERISGVGGGTALLPQYPWVAGFEDWPENGGKPPVSKGMLAMMIGNPLRLKDVATNANTGYGPFLVRPATVLLYDQGVPDESFLMWDRFSDDVARVQDNRIGTVLRNQNIAWENLMKKAAFGN